MVQQGLARHHQRVEQESLCPTSKTGATVPCRAADNLYVYVDGIYLRRNWGGEYENVAILVAIAVNEDGFREVLGAVRA